MVRNMVGRHYRMSDHHVEMLDELVSDMIITNACGYISHDLNRSDVLRWLIQRAHDDLVERHEIETRKEDAALAADVKKSKRAAKKCTAIRSKGK